jgi:hypothetical protein
VFHYVSPLTGNRVTLDVLPGARIWSTLVRITGCET